MANAMGPAMYLVCTLAGLAIFTPVFLLYFSHAYYVTLTYSSTGEDHFRWPKDTIIDWMGQGAPCIGVKIVWSSLGFLFVAPLFLWLPVPMALAGWFLFVWVIVPISLCSVLTGPSWMLLIYPPLVGRLLRQLAGLCYVYLLTLPLFVPAGVGAYYLLRGEPWGIVLLSVSLPAAVLLHARAWGRLVWLALNYDLPKPGRKKKRRPKPEGEILTPELEPLPDEPKPGGVALPLDDEAAYSVAERRASPKDGETVLTDYYAKDRKRAKEWRKRAGEPIADPFAPPEPPTYGTAMGSKIYTFMSYEETLTIWLRLGFTCAFEAGLVLMLVQVLQM